MSEMQNERSEALFNELNRKKKKRRNRIVRTVIIVLLVVAIVLVAAVSIMTERVREQFGSSGADVLTYQAKKGTISTTISGSGTLEEVDLEAVTVPEGVEIVDVLVEADETIAAGDVLATVDMSTVMSALAATQADLDALDQQISEARGEEVSGTVKAGISGRVKIIYAAADMSVVSCMAEYGALAVISLDGYMAVDIETDGLVKGDTVTVIRAGGKEIDGTVDTVSSGVATILVTDNGPQYGEEVSVAGSDGATLGSGSLYIHSPLRITGYAGTVKKVSVSENDKVKASTTLLTLKDTGSSANYDTLLRQREEKEETLMELLELYRDGAVLAPMDGIVSSVEYGAEDSASTTVSAYLPSTGAGETTEGTALLTIYPNISMSVTVGIDETDILTLELGQEADVQVSSVSEDTVYTGTVTQINKTANTTSGVTQYSAVVTLDKVAGMLPGMTASVDIKIEGVEDVIIIPVDALHQTSTISYVYTSYDPETNQYGGMVEVTTGMQNSDYVEIISGLSVGDTVYYTETESFFFGFGNFGGGNFGGGMPSGFGGGNFGG